MGGREGDRLRVQTSYLPPILTFLVPLMYLSVQEAHVHKVHQAHHVEVNPGNNVAKTDIVLAFSLVTSFNALGLISITQLKPQLKVLLGSIPHIHTFFVLNPRIVKTKPSHEMSFCFTILHNYCTKILDCFHIPEQHESDLDEFKMSLGVLFKEDVLTKAED